VSDHVDAWFELARGLDQRGTAELTLVLEAAGIEHRSAGGAGGSSLYVPVEQAERAAEQVAIYVRENAAVRLPKPPPAMIGRGGLGVVAYAAVLMIVAVFVRQFAFGFDWLASGRMDAGGVRAGEWWRAVTALTVHLDLAHLGGNLAFGGFFAYFVARYFGAGLGWLAIVLSGTLGNLINAYVQTGDHRSIGASTAVFGALALLTVNAWRHGFSTATSWRARMAPLVAGVALLAFTGTGGENTDIVAHLTGFVAGFGLGLAIVRYALVGRGPTLQAASGWTAAGLVAGAWAVALASG
jgi:membrane associated rhomboid family serine protease